MLLSSLLTSVCFIATVASHSMKTPQVHEIVDESTEPKSSRHPRQPESFAKVYTPPKFEYKSAVQQNPRLLRYYRQQQVDLAQRRKQHPLATALLENTRRNIHILPVTVAQPEQLLRVARKLTSRHYNTEESGPQAIYVQPEHDLKALNDLIGKNPNVQLEGLKQLLENPSQVQLIMPVDPAPFQAPHLQNKQAAEEAPKELVFKPDGTSSISKLQAELDASARLQAQKAIEAAQRQALAHVEEQHKAIAKAQEEARRIAMERVRAHNEAISQVYVGKQEDGAETAENRQQVVAFVAEAPQQQIVHPEENQEELQRLAEESNRAYGGDDVSKSKCKKFVNEKLEMFRQQFCNHLKSSPAKGVVRNETLKDFVLELNCVKMERAKSFFSTKLREMYRENRKAFFSLCYFNVSDVQLINEFVFSNNLTDFNENLLRQKREIYNETEHANYGNKEDETSDATTDVLPSASALKLVAQPKFAAKHPHYQQPQNGQHKQPTNVIVINNSNDNHNHGASVQFQDKVPAHRPFIKNHRHKKPKRTHTHKIIIHHKKPSVKRILRVSKKVDTVLNKLGHTIIRIR